MYSIKQNEPEGWTKAYYVFWNEEHVATFRYKDSAEAYVSDDVMKRTSKTSEHPSSQVKETYNAWDF